MERAQSGAEENDDIEVAGAEDARAEVRHQYERGFRHIKVYTDLSAEDFLAQAAKMPDA